MFNRLKKSNYCSDRHRSLTIENLEERRMMTTNVFLDFGSAWQLEDGIFDVTGVNGSNFTNNQLIPVVDMIQDKDRALDHNLDGNFNQSDVDALAADLVASLERIYAPFDVHFSVVSSESVKDIESLLASTASNDTYVLIGEGLGASSGGQGQFGFTEGDSVAVAYADVFVGRYREDQVGDGTYYSSYPVSLNMGGFTRSVAHEIGHNFDSDIKTPAPSLPQLMTCMEATSWSTEAPISLLDLCAGH